MDSPEPAQPSANEAPSGLNKGAILILAMVVLGVGALVISSLSTPSPEEDFEKRLDAPNVHTVTLDTSGLIYSWLDVKKGMRSARQLRHVPRAKLGAVQLWHEQWPAPPDDRIYIADLLHAVPGEEVTATLRSRRYLHAATHAGDIGEVHGMLTEFLASEIAAFDPESDRQQASRAAAKTFEKVEAVRPISYDESFEQLLRHTGREPAKRPPAKDSVSRETPDWAPKPKP